MTRLARDLLRVMVKASRGWYCLRLRRRFRKDERAALAELTILGFAVLEPDNHNTPPGLRDGDHIFAVTEAGVRAFSRKTKREGT